MLGISIRDLVTYTNLAYLTSLLVTFILTASLWRVTIAAQNENELELEKYKTEAAVRIAEANTDASKAHKEAAEANARAEEAVKQTAEARLATEELRDQVAFRKLSDEQLLKFSVLKSKSIKITVEATFADPEAMLYAAQINIVLNVTGVSAGPIARITDQFLGTVVMGPDDENSRLITDTLLLTDPKVAYKADDAYRIFVGTRYPPFVLP